MPCVSPLTGWRARTKEPSGKRKIVFDKQYGYSDMEVEVPCGKCWACRLARSRDWAVRCMHEASLHQENCFITLTYNNQNLPENGSLVTDQYVNYCDVKTRKIKKRVEVPGHFQLFMKKLRKEVYPKKIRFFHCGEYGSLFDKNGQPIKGSIGRPHYHALIFGYDFPDRLLFREKRGVKLYTSEMLEKLWGKGFVTVGDVTFESAAYVARYIMKKIGGEKAHAHYARDVDKETGEFINHVLPEYTTMSRRPGIAAEWFDRYKEDLKKDFITVRKKHGIEKFRPPKYYDGLFEIEDPEHYEKMKARRRKHVKDNYDPDRHEDALTIKKQQISLLKREL